MIAQEIARETQHPLTIEERRAFHRLPLAERRRLLAEQAERAAAYYEEVMACEEHQEWQSGDIVES